MDEPPWQPVSANTLTLDTAWQKVDLEGVYNSDATGSVRVALLNGAGTVWVDEMTIFEVAKNDLAPVTSVPIPDTLFGMHVNRLGVHASWPGLGTKIVRLWDTGTTWRDLKPSPGAWDFTTNGARRLDMYVDYVRRNDPQADILYTLGQTPTWASSTPWVDSPYGPGAGGAPSDMNDWRDYVRTLARRYAGRIHYWELWNEPDYTPFFNSGFDKLVEMARIAREELLAADPNNRLIGPGFSTDQGMTGLETFLVAGGGQYIDMVGFHWYYGSNPEALVASIDNVRNVMKAHGIADKPLWNTEGAFICNPAVVDCSTAQPTAEESRSVNARALLLMAGKGVQNFNFYVWETLDPMGKLVEADFQTPTMAATAYAEARSWIKGASIIDAYRIDGRVYVYRLVRGAESFVILWATQPGTPVTLPSAWGVRSARSLTGSEWALTSSQLSLGIKVSRFAATEHQPAHATVVYRRGDEFLVGSLVSRVAGSRHENRQPDQEAVPDRPSLVAIFQEA
jgi:hypothetical protein